MPRTLLVVPLDWRRALALPISLLILGSKRPLSATGGGVDILAGVAVFGLLISTTARFDGAMPAGHPGAIVMVVVVGDDAVMAVVGELIDAVVWQLVGGVMGSKVRAPGERSG